MYKIQLILFLFLFPVFAFSQNQKQVTKIKTMLLRQAEKWNNFDIVGFMDDYWKSDQLVFMGSQGPTYGWQSTLDRYKKAYPNQAAMGVLKFDIIKIDLRSRKVATVVGKYYLTRKDRNDLSGYFLLVCKKIKGKWKIVADHTSS